MIRCLKKSLKTAYLFENYALIICNFKDDTTKVSLSNIEDSGFGDFVKTQKNKSELKCSDYFESGDP